MDTQDLNNAQAALIDFLKNELDDYSFFRDRWLIIKDLSSTVDDLAWFTVSIRDKDVLFRVELTTNDWADIYIEIFEDTFKQCAGYEGNSKYLWMTILKWE